jgi:PhzF family phenazine biosynthesis protein
MRTLPMWQVDAFTSRRFGGNPACVVALEQWLDDATLQAIAAENNLSETAFLVPEHEEYAIRWFTPAIEVKLCGHATLASAHVVFTHLAPKRAQVRFASKSGALDVALDRASARITLDFPQYDCAPSETTPELVAALNGARPTETWLGVKLMAVFEREAHVRALAPDFAKVAALPGFGLIATAPGDACDFVSRYFVPQAGVNEDPVTGAAHCQLTPWWAKRLGRARMTARQVSSRGGELWVEHVPPRVQLAGHAVEYMRATIQL